MCSPLWERVKPAVTAAAVIHAAPHTPAVSRTGSYLFCSCADLSGAVQQSFHIPQRMFTLEHPQIDPRCASAHFIKPPPTILAVASPGAPTQHLVWLTRPNCVLLEATAALHLSAADMQSTNELRRAIIRIYIYYMIIIILRQCVSHVKLFLFFFLLRNSVCCEEACATLFCLRGSRKKLLHLMTQQSSISP